MFSPPFLIFLAILCAIASGFWLAVGVVMPDMPEAYVIGTVFAVFAWINMRSPDDRHDEDES